MAAPFNEVKVLNDSPLSYAAKRLGHLIQGRITAPPRTPLSGLYMALEHFLFCACARKHTGAEALLAFLKAYIPFGKYAPEAVNAHKGGCGVLNKHATGVPLREFIGLCQADV